MTAQNSLSPIRSAHPSLDPVLLDPALIGTSLKVEIEQAVRLSLVVALQLVHAAARIDLPLVNDAGRPPLGPRRANLQAAAQHAALGHESPTFRDCSRPMCRDAANLVAYPITTEPGATDAELDAAFQREMAILAVDAPEAAEAQWGSALTALVVQDRVGPLFEQFWADLTQLRLN